MHGPRVLQRPFAELDQRLIERAVEPVVLVGDTQPGLVVADAVVRVSDYPRLAFTGLVTFFGSLNVAVPFLLDLFRIPADSFQLFLASGVVNARFGTLVAAVHTLAVALLGSCAMVGALQWNRQRLVRYAIVTAALTLAVIGGTRLLFARILDQSYTKDKVLAGIHLLRAATPAKVYHTPPPVPSAPEDADALGSIRSRGSLRVGYFPDALPFAFFNARDELVGFDIELAYRLADELGVRLELVPTSHESVDADLARGYCDLVMSGVAVTTDRARQTTMSTAYLDETMAFVVPDSARERFATWDSIKSSGPLTLAVPDVPYYIEKLRVLLPHATLRPVSDLVSVLKAMPPDVDGLVLPAPTNCAYQSA